MSNTQAYGLWPSPLSPRSLAGGLRLYDVQWDSDGQTLVWLEGRSDRGVLVCAPADGSSALRDLTVDISVRARVGYGGGDFTVSQGLVFFVAADSGRLYRQALAGGAAQAITPAFGRAAAPVLSPDGRWLLFVHSYEDIDSLALVDAAGAQWPQRLVQGHDFYMQPCWHPDGRRIAYVAWNHPLMPWDGTTLYLAELSRDGAPVVTATHVIAGGDDVAVFQPAFSPDGRWLSYVADQSGVGQIYLYDLASGNERMLTAGSGEHGQPAWAQGMRSYGWGHDSQTIFLTRSEYGIRRLSAQPIAGGTARELQPAAGYSWFDQPACSPTAAVVASIASASTRPPRLVVADTNRMRVARYTTTETISADELAPAQPISWRSAGGVEVHGLLYLPRGYQPGGDGLLPPAIVRIHGGPTGQSTAAYSAPTQFFTTRGYVVLDVNYRGSTGYGRAYMLALRENWGICDVEDAISAAQHLADARIADPARLVIMGGSAGGYTVLEALCRAPGRFRAGLCMYGVSNLFGLAADTHKFEARYLDSMVGPLPAASDRYRDRSPLFHADLIKDPLAVFQGSEDRVVPQDQSDSIVASLRRRGVPHEYHLYAGEGHGWRKQETIEAFYTALEKFLQQYVLFA